MSIISIPKKVAACLAALTFITAPSMELCAQELLPRPSSVDIHEGFFTVADGIGMYTNLYGDEAQMLTDYVRATSPVQIRHARGNQKKNYIKFVVTADNDEVKASETPQMQGYNLTITPKGITVEAPSAMGLFYGWQTLRQWLADGNSVRCVHISDQPRFAYRGVMIDCSRHMWTADFIKKQIDAMAYVKMDRLHLHLTDAGGWRMEVKKYPELTEKAAWRTSSPWETWWDGKERTYCTADTPGAYGGYYTQDELRDIVEYARQRHITVVPEIEMPGHSDEVTYAYPYLSCKGEPYTSGDLCVGKESTFKFLEDVLMETMDVFPSEYIHIGGDEASRTAWETCPDCQKRMQEEGLETTAELQSYLTHRIEKFLNAHGRKLLGWDEILEGELAPNATVMSWRGTEGGLKAAQMGHDVIMTPGAYCYLDAYQDAPPTQPKGFGSYVPLDKVYSYDPVPEELRGTEGEKYIYGVQANLWTELVETPEHVEYMLYPRSLAVAEVGWSAEKDDYQSFRKRTEDILSQMRAGGYHTFDLANEVGHRPGSITPVSHEAVGKKVIYVTEPYMSYTGQGVETLTNGYEGDWNYNDGQWQGFIPRGFEAVIDMGRVTDIHDISLEFMQFAGPGVYFPSSVTYSVSDDNEQFEIIGEKTYEYDETPYFIRPSSWQGTARGRYVRVSAGTPQKGGFVFTNEVVINRK